MWFEERLIFFPSVYPAGDWDSLTEMGISYEEQFFFSSDGTKLHAWYVPHRRPSAFVLYCHGNAGNLSHRNDPLEQLHHQVGAATLIFDYRGYGKSEGTPYEKGILEDALAARDLLMRIAGVPPEEIVLLGRSIGAAIATHLATLEPSPRQRLILESTFTSLPDLAARLYPFLPVKTMLRSRFPVLTKIADFRGSLLLSHGDADELVPWSDGKKVYESASQSKHREFFTVEGGDHNSPQPSEYYREILPRFLESNGEF